MLTRRLLRGAGGRGVPLERGYIAAGQGEGDKEVLTQVAFNGFHSRDGAGYGLPKRSGR